MKFLDSKIISDIREVSSLMYGHGWTERNAGNISIFLPNDEVNQYEDLKPMRVIPMRYTIEKANGMVFIVTGTGKRLKDINKDPLSNIGVVRIIDGGTNMEVLWGFSSGANPTSEFASHIYSHLARLEVDDTHRVVMHCHPVNVIAMTFIHKLGDKEFTLSLWKTITECVLIFGDGVAVLPWMSAGSEAVALETAEKLKECRAVIWGQHGIFASESNLEDAFGLIETVEKGAEIYMHTFSKPIINEITLNQLKEVCEIYEVKPKIGYLD